MDQRLRIREALGLSGIPRIAAVGAGGKTTFLLKLAGEYSPNVILTTSTHFSVEEAGLVDTHIILHSQEEIDSIFQKGIHGVTMLTGEQVEDDRLAGLPMDWMDKVATWADLANLPLLVEADGSRRLPVKAPASHEPAIPSWVREVVVSVGLSGIGAPIDSRHVHRPELVLNLTHQEPGSIVTSHTIETLLGDPSGGLKNIPPGARKIALLNQADDELLEAAGGRIARALVDVFDSLLVASLHEKETPIKAVFAPSGAVILAAGKSDRFEGGNKVLLDWFGEPFVRHIAKTAVNAHLTPVFIVAGKQLNAVTQAVEGLPVVLLENHDWESGQSTSIQTGIRNLPDRVRSVIFLLADQPQVTETLLSALIEEHRRTASPIIAPLVEERRANPVLFDRATFDHLLSLEGDTGGRAIFSKYQVDYLPWFDRLMLLDVDTREDYSRLINIYGERLDV